MCRTSGQGWRGARQPLHALRQGVGARVCVSDGASCADVPVGCPMAHEAQGVAAPAWCAMMFATYVGGAPGDYRAPREAVCATADALFRIFGMRRVNAFHADVDRAYRAEWYAMAYAEWLAWHDEEVG